MSPQTFRPHLGPGEGFPCPPPAPESIAAPSGQCAGNCTVCDRLCDAQPGDGINLTERGLTHDARVAMYPEAGRERSVSRHPATWRTQAALAIGRGTADDAEFAAADRVLDALEREGALLTDRQRQLLRPSVRETPGDRPSAPVAARSDAAAPSGCPRTVWDGPYSFRCNQGASVGICATHGRFRPTSPTGEPR